MTPGQRKAILARNYDLCSYAEGVALFNAGVFARIGNAVALTGHGNNVRRIIYGKRGKP